jgi:hypothetical protein
MVSDLPQMLPARERLSRVDREHDERGELGRAGIEHLHCHAGSRLLIMTDPLLAFGAQKL